MKQQRRRDDTTAYFFVSTLMSLHLCLHAYVSPVKPGFSRRV